MSAYEIGVLVGALCTLGLIAFVATRLASGSAMGRIIGAVVALAVVGAAASRVGCADRRKVESFSRGFIKACDRSCRAESAGAAECKGYCECSAGQLRRGRSDSEFVAWLEANEDTWSDPERLAQFRAEVIPVCGRKLVHRQFVANCQKSCTAEAPCPPGVCECVADLLLADAHFGDPQWIKQVVLATEETPEATAWGQAAFAKCDPELAGTAGTEATPAMAPAAAPAN